MRFKQRPQEADREISQETVAACRRGERGALEVVFRAHTRDVEVLLARLAGPRGDVEDLLQTTLLAAIQAFPRYRGEASLKTWLSRIAVHVFHDHLRRQSYRRHLPLEVLHGDPPDHRPLPDRQVETKRRLQRLYFHLDALAPNRRIPFVLHVLEGRPIDEVAQIVGSGSLATRSRIFWARRQLLAHLAEDPCFAGLAAGGEESI